MRLQAGAARAATSRAGALDERRARRSFTTRNAHRGRPNVKPADHDRDGLAVAGDEDAILLRVRDVLAELCLGLVHCHELHTIAPVVRALTASPFKVIEPDWGLRTKKIFNAKPSPGGSPAGLCVNSGLPSGSVLGSPLHEAFGWCSPHPVL